MSFLGWVLALVPVLSFGCAGSVLQGSQYATVDNIAVAFDSPQAKGAKEPFEIHVGMVSSDLGCDDVDLGCDDVAVTATEILHRIALSNSIVPHSRTVQTTKGEAL